jgi:hypothetical protein
VRRRAGDKPAHQRVTKDKKDDPPDAKEIEMSCEAGFTDSRGNEQRTNNPRAVASQKHATRALRQALDREPAP